MSSCISGEGEEAVDFYHRLGRQLTESQPMADLEQIDRPVWVAVSTAQARAITSSHCPDMPRPRRQTRNGHEQTAGTATG